MDGPDGSNGPDGLFGMRVDGGTDGGWRRIRNSAVGS